jgi:tetratricopeptide (TPR) repeat protein
MDAPYSRTFVCALLFLGTALLTSSFLTGCRRGEPIDPAERLSYLLERAALEASVFNYNDALRSYTEARALAEFSTDEWIEATFGAATAAWHRLPPNRSSIAEARQLFESLVEAIPEDSIFHGRALLNLGRLAEQRNFPGDIVDSEAARVLYRKVQSLWTGHILADEAAGRLAASALREFERPEIVRAALVELENYIENRPESPIASVLFFFLGEKYWTYLKDGERSFAAFERALEIGLVEQARIWQVYWRMAELAERELGQPLTAAAYFRRIVEETPRSPRIFEARRAYERIQARFPDELEDLPPVFIP